MKKEPRVEVVVSPLGVITLQVFDGKRWQVIDVTCASLTPREIDRMKNANRS